VNSPLKRSGMVRVLKGSHCFTCISCVHPLTEWSVPAFTFPAEAGPHLLNPEGWKAELIAVEPRCWHVLSESTSVVNFQPTYSQFVTSCRSWRMIIASVRPQLWNSLPDDTTSASSVTVFRRRRKTHLFRQSYPDIITQLVCGCSRHGIVRTVLFYLGHLQNCYVMQYNIM